MRLYQSLPQGYQKDIPKMLITDSQINTVAKAYIKQLRKPSVDTHKFVQTLQMKPINTLNRSAPFSLPQGYQKDIPKMLITDSQINTVAKAYINDKNFGSLGE